jgi:hypothetical protein
MSSHRVAEASTLIVILVVLSVAPVSAARLTGQTIDPAVAFNLCFPGLCDAACMVALPMFYPQVIAHLKIAKRLGVLKNRKQCESVAGDASKLAKVLYEAKFGPLAGAAAKVVAGRCGRCACGTVF